MARVFVTDVVGNQRSYTATELAQLGFPAALVVGGEQEVTPPTLTAFSFTPMAIDTSSEPASVAVSWSATDDLAGVQTLQVDFTSPSGNQSRAARQDVAPAINASGIVNVTFPPFILEPGIWMARVFVTDVVGNQRSYTATELAQLGFPAALVVGQEEDTTPPVIT